MKIKKNFDVIVVGAGHAGIEATWAVAKMGSKVLLVTIDLDKIGLMPCNPAIGGIGKGHIVFEIGAFGGLMPKIAAKSYLQVRMLNTSRGPAVHGLRLQIDKVAYSKKCKVALLEAENIDLLEDLVEEILVDNEKKVSGVKLLSGDVYGARFVIVTTGTFLNGLIHMGHETFSAGRDGEVAANGLSKSLEKLGIKLTRLKTGTPARLLKSSLDFSKMEKQEAHDLDYLFEFYPHKAKSILDCYITHTTEETHTIIKDHAEFSPIYLEKIKGIPPRYCPSIEDKIVRFPDKKSHNVFVEPESLNGESIYPNGISTSLPKHVQEKFIRSIPGFEKAELLKPGYAIEYDFADPCQLKSSLEVKSVENLFFAGQINGTTGYEEAAGQGLIAGINAVLKIRGAEPFVLDRNESYIGVMIDDLINVGVDEPYRMFTSRAERRLILRQDNAFFRLGKYAYNLGLIDNKLYDAINKEYDFVQEVKNKIEINYKKELLNFFAEKKVLEVCELIKKIAGENISGRAVNFVFAELLYGPYLHRELREIERSKVYKNLEIPENLDFKNLPGLSVELQQKLLKYKPKNIAEAFLIQGMTPAAISLLIFKSRKRES